MILSNRATDVTSKWITDNGYWKEIKNLLSVEDLKRWIIKKFFGEDKPNEAFIKGAKLVNWKSIFDTAKM